MKQRCDFDAVVFEPKSMLFRDFEVLVNHAPSGDTAKADDDIRRDQTNLVFQIADAGVLFIRLRVAVVRRAALDHVADVEIQRNKSIVTIICDADHSSSILASGFGALAKAGINVQMISQGASKVNITVICDDEETNLVVNTLHSAFFA